MIACHDIEPEPTCDIALSIARALIYRWSASDDRIAFAGGDPRILGLERGVEGMAASVLQGQIAADDQPARALAMTRHLNGGDAFDITYKLRHPNGRVVWIRERAGIREGLDGEPAAVEGLLQDVTSTVERANRLERLAFRDELTGVLNRAGIIDALRNLAQSGVSRFGYGIVNVDRLGVINENHGHPAADALLRHVAAFLDTEIRGDDRVGRVGGNQFGLVLHDIDQPGLQQRLEAILSKSRGNVVETPAGPMAYSLSIGASTFDSTVGNPATVMGQAEEALHQAKRSGRDRYSLYQLSRETLERRRRSFATGDMVLTALKERRVTLAYQQIVGVEDHEPRLWEALARLVTREGEVIAAGQFMPVVEELGLVRLVDRCTVERAVKELDDNRELYLAVNLSGVTVSDPNALQDILGQLREHAQVAPRLTVEITETVAISDLERSQQLIEGLKGLGCRIALDDFGAGYTSFQHLKTLPIDTVKIDGSYVRDLDQNPDNQLFVKALLYLAEGLNVETVAECVETERDAALLTDLGVDLLQGFHFGRPDLSPPWRAAGPADAATESEAAALRRQAGT